MAVYNEKAKKEFENSYNSIDKWKIPITEKTRLKKYIKEYRRGQVTGKIRENPESNLAHTLQQLKICLEYFNKDIKKLTKKDTDDFSSDLFTGEIKKSDGKKYGSGKRILVTFKTYLKHYNIKNDIIKKLKKDIEEPMNEKEVLKKDYVEDVLCKLHSTRPWHIYVYLTLFWGGLRRMELIGLRIKDIKLPKGDENFVKIKIRREITKNNQGVRVVTLYGANCFNAVKNYINYRKSMGVKDDEQLLEISEEGLKSFFVRLRDKLNIHIHAHLFRHSSATFICKTIFKRDLFKCCDFFGWAYNSPQVNRYIRRKQAENIGDVEEDETDGQITQTTLQEIRKEVGDIETIKNIEIEELKNQMAEITGKFAEFSEGKKETHSSKYR
jgi:site-specific recombinase XerD